jgi:hypothetical protein
MRGHFEQSEKSLLYKNIRFRSAVLSACGHAQAGKMTHLLNPTFYMFIVIDHPLFSEHPLPSLYLFPLHLSRATCLAIFVFLISLPNIVCAIAKSIVIVVLYPMSLKKAVIFACCRP